MFGLTSTAVKTMGRPILKPWRIASNVPAFSSLCRRCSHVPTDHARCEHSDTKATEGYTDELASCIHHCFASCVGSSCLGGDWLATSTNTDDSYVLDF
jgi:hypothetical protein